MRSARASQLGPGRLAAVAAVVALLASLVAVASGGRTVSGERGGGLSPVVADLLVIVISTTGVALFVLLAPQALTLARDERRARDAHGRKKAPLLLVAILVVASLALLATAMPEIVDGLRDRGLLGGNAAQNGGSDGTTAPEEGATGGQMLTTLLLTLAAIAAVVAWTRRGKTSMRERSLREDMVEAIDEGVDDLRGDADPRRATIEAYARMERVCAYHGLPRQPSEAPGEFLSRTLVPLGAGADGARRLTGLFELAGFSAHAVGEPERAQAIDALCSVRDALQEAGA